ncbi:MAG TPA: NifU family protein [Gemmataceae bacterium]|nr:NifU family protein [Gemmataceae bacterium]
MTATLKERLERLIAEEIAPALQLDVSQIEVVDVADGVARLRLGAVCASCPSTVMFVINGIEQELRKRLPEIDYVEVVP